ncbi:MAG: glycerol-3-phosphate dehydrogenase/oxidase [Gammaproteobacteria bacterium]|nr:glycerol-3-phosphate dehydrogenase/oxidase [Gammaproteobacteria bacterium]MDH5729098.1 glycerol-3-phosphate dehydrogenase/oxidase [Gammaproteobacteria bacterium]
MRRVDLLIIGGGINGVGVAQAAAAAGYSVVLLEKTGLASGTSSRSSKLIHGGLRYLETAQFGLVRECLHERRLLLKNAPELVKLEPFYIPVYKTTTRSPWKLRLGLSAYALLNGLHHGSRFRQVPRSEWEALDGLNQSGLKAVFQYWDAQTDDAKLTTAVMRSAQSLGAELLMPAEFLSAHKEPHYWQVEFLHEGEKHELECMAIVNAAGPWVNQVLGLMSPQQSPRNIELVQGTHIILNESLSHGFYYVEAPHDKRAVFVMPWYGKVMVGTTETTFHGDPGKVEPSREELRYLLDTLSYYFPRFRAFNIKQIEQAFAGIRVLPAAKGSAFKRARDTVYHMDNEFQPSLLTIYGGKLTAYRATAETVLKKLRPALPPRTTKADTRELTLIPA